MTSRLAKEREAIERAKARANGSVERLGTRMAKAEKREDKRDLRRKIVAGAAILTMTRKDPKLRAQVGSFLQAFARREIDRIALELDEPETFLDRDAREAAEAERAEQEAKARDAAAVRESGVAPNGAPVGVAGAGARERAPSVEASGDNNRMRPSSGAPVVAAARAASPIGAVSAASGGGVTTNGAPSA